MFASIADRGRRTIKPECSRASQGPTGYCSDIELIHGGPTHIRDNAIIVGISAATHPWQSTFSLQ
jgi:hypothetical protein